ncbi:MAG: hypothetical protein V4719_07525 [Planctomycetota bacterium]
MIYRLLLIGQFDSQDATSAKFFSEEFLCRFRQLGHTVLPLDFHSTEFPTADVVLIHSYHGTPALRAFPSFRQYVRYSAMFMEVPCNIGCDHYFYYDGRSYPQIAPEKLTMISAPVVRSYYRDVPKLPGSILLDHDVSFLPLHDNLEYDWNRLIWSELARRRDDFSEVYQLERGDPGEHPEFIKIVPLSNHQDYLARTAGFETFICTHAGSYNHTVVDMVARGTRVVVPATLRGPFVPPSLTELFGMKIYNDVHSLLAECFEPANKAVAPLAKTTDLDTIVQMIDAKFRAAMSAAS